MCMYELNEVGLLNGCRDVTNLKECGKKYDLHFVIKYEHSEIKPRFHNDDC